MLVPDPASSRGPPCSGLGEEWASLTARMASGCTVQCSDDEPARPRSEGGLVS